MDIRKLGKLPGITDNMFVLPEKTDENREVILIS